MKSIISRIGLSLLSILIYGWANFLLNPIATIGSGIVAGKQFQSNDQTHVLSMWGMDFFTHLGIPFVLLVIVLVAIWFKPLKAWIAGLAVVMAVTVASLTAVPQTARAYYDKSDYAEAYFILPNESAFWIPDVGDNKNNQAKFGSEEYLNSAKVAAKRFLIPHTKLPGSGSITDYYVPAGRLIIVDRAPYHREWAAAPNRGTSSANQAFPCQSAEGLNITVEVAIAASVHEENAAKFLYFFGITPPKGDRTDPNVTFQSVYHGKSLMEVMDSVGRGRIQSLVCRELTKRKLDDANAQAGPIMDTVEKDAMTWLASRGITLDYIGWAGTFEFDPSVQQAINDRYNNEKIAPMIGVMERNANIVVKHGLAEGLKKGLPNFLPPQMMNWFTSIFGTASPEPVKK